MKKAKTIIASLFVALASILVSACSCGGSGGDVPSIYVTDIDLTCTSTSQTVTITDGEIPYIKCHVGDSFKIEYNLSPVDATVTQVDWEFSVSGLVKPVNKEYSRAKSTRETVEFVAVDRSSTSYETRLTFTANPKTEAVKKGFVDIVVYPAVTELPTLVDLTEEDISFNNASGAVCWTPVTQVVKADGQVVTAELSNGVARGLIGYQVVYSYKDALNEDKTVTWNVGPKTTSCKPSDVIIDSDNDIRLSDTGVEYSVKVRALGDEDNVKSSDYSPEFKYYKLNPVVPAYQGGTLENRDNGIAFTTPEYSSQQAIYYYGIEKGYCISDGNFTVAPNTEIHIPFNYNTFSYRPAGEENTRYSIQVVSFPEGYNSLDGYATKGDVRYYPSTEADPLVVQRLEFKKENISLESTRKEATVGGVSFPIKSGDTLPQGSTNLVWTLDQVYSPAYNQGMKYTIYRLGVDGAGAETAESVKTGRTTTNENYISLEGLDAGYSYRIELTIVGDNATIIYDINDEVAGYDETTTFTLNTVSYEFTILPKFEVGDIILSNDILELASTTTNDVTTYNYGYSNVGLEVFFIYQGSDAEKYSKRFELSSKTDISKLGLTQGTYNVYCKPITSTSESINYAIVSSTLDTTTDKLMTFDVANAPTNLNVQNEGLVSWSRASFADPDSGDTKYLENYRIIVKQMNTDLTLGEILVYAPLTTGSDDEIHYTLSADEKTATANLIDIIKACLRKTSEYQTSSNKDATLQTLLDNYLYFASNALSCSIQAFGYEDNGYTLLSSSPSKAVYFSSYSQPTGLELNNYVLSFDAVVKEYQSDNTTPKSYVDQYVVGLQTINPETGAIVNSYTFTHSGSWTIDSESGRVSTNLKTDEKITISGTEYYLADLINSQLNNTITVSTLGYDGMQDAKLNSYATSMTFGVTNQPTNLNVDEDGLITWRTTTSKDEALTRTYLIKFYLVTLDDGVEVLEYLSNLDFSATPTFVEEGQTSEEVESEDESGNTITITEYTNYVVLSTNISALLTEEYDNKVIAFTIEETKSDMFTGNISSKFYVTRISAPELQWSLDNSSSTITWIKSSIANNITHDVVVTKEGEAEALYTGNIGSDTTFAFSSIASENSWTEGVYTVSVIAKTSSESTSTSATNPYILSSVEGSKTIHMANIADLNISISDNIISWDNICAGTSYEATYTINYVTSNGDDVVYTIVPTTKDELPTYEITYKINDGEQSTEYNDKFLTYNSDSTKISINVDNLVTPFTEGDNNFTITPSIDYETSGFILINTPVTKSITKWQKADGLTTLNGNLTFNVYGATDADSVGFDIYRVTTVESDTTYTALGSSQYKIVQTLTEDGEGNSFSYIQFVVALDGINVESENEAITLAVKLKSEGKLTSDYSNTVTGVKIASVTDLSKNGNWLSWTAQSGISQYLLYYGNVADAELTELILTVEAYGNGYTTSSYDASEFYYSSTDNKFYYAFNYTDFIGEKTGDFIFRIRPTTTMAGYFNGNTSGPLTITKLNNNVEITIVDGKINISNYVADGSQTPQGYIVTIYKLVEGTITDADGNESQGLVRDISYTISGGYTADGIAPIDLNYLCIEEGGTQTYPFRDKGDYEVELTFIGDKFGVSEEDSILITSATLTEDTLYKLDTTSLYTVDGVVAWGKVEGAEDYTIELTDGTNTIYCVVGKESMTEADLKYTQTAEDGSTSEVTFVLQPNTNYSLRVKSNASGKLHSKWSSTFVVKKLIAPDNVTISTSNGTITVEFTETSTGEDGSEVSTTTTKTFPSGSPIITWTDSNDNRDGLDYVLKYDDKTLVDIVSPASLMYVVNPDMPVGDYLLQLQLIGNTTLGKSGVVGLLTSDFSSGTNAVYSADVTDVSVSNGNITWQEMSGAYSYTITAYEKDTYAKFLAGTYTLISSDIVFTTTVTTNSFDFSTVILADSDDYAGNYTFVINAHTNPSTTIISNHSSVENDNYATLFKPQILSNFRVKDGKLNWRMAISDIEDFVDGVGDKLALTGELNDLIEYILDKINLSKGENPDLEEQIVHLLQVTLNINDNEITEYPSSAMVVKEDGTQITNNNKYATDGEYIEFSYDVSSQEETITSPDDSTTEGDEEGSEDETESEPEIATVSEESGSETKYLAGKYVVKISVPGNSSTTAPVVNSLYSQELTAFKPATPRTWTATNGSDISKGRVQWELSTTATSTFETFNYHEDYMVTATPAQGEGVAYTTVNVSDTLKDGTNSNLNGCMYYRDLKGDLFTTSDQLTPEEQATATNILKYNVNYKLQINSLGTADSTQLESGEPIYLNSNKCTVGAVANILGTTSGVKVENSEVRWTENIVSTMTKLFIYGPFDNLSEDKTALNTNWASTDTNDGGVLTENIYEIIYNAYVGNTEYFKENMASLGIASEDDIPDFMKEYSNKLHIIEFEPEEGNKKTIYTLTNQYINSNPMYEAGGYIFKFQEIGDDKGIVDSDISDDYAVNKLAPVTMQTNGWVGISASTVYVWDSTTDSWAATTVDARGMFVWNPVVGANAYSVELYYMTDGGSATQIGRPTLTRETKFDLNDTDVVISDKAITYFVRITAIRTDDDNISQLSDNYFSSDYKDTTAHARLVTPADLVIDGDGIISWEKESTHENVANYRVQFNYNLTAETKDVYGQTTNVPKFDLGTGNQSGTIAIAIKAVAYEMLGEENNKSALLNSPYCSAITVTRIKDPDARLEEGVFNWGWIVSNGDIATPLTTSELSIKNPSGTTTDYEYTKDSGVTSYTLYTDILEHNADYTAESDVYKTGEYTFSVRFAGTTGNTSDESNKGKAFYIASNLKTLTATKLDAPVIENVTLDLAESNENLVKWTPVTNALGYRVRVFYSNGTKVDNSISTEDLNAILEGASHNYFAVEGDSSVTTIYFRLKDIINNPNFNSAEGDAVYIYVQALGSGVQCDSDTDNDIARPEYDVAGNQTNDDMFLSSSYSTPTIVKVPARPDIDITTCYDSTSGTLSWSVSDDDKTGIGIKLVTKYDVTGVSVDDFNNYWKASSNYIGTQASTLTENTVTYKPYSQIISRSIIYSSTTIDNVTTYSLQVTDVIYLSPDDNNKTPTSYQLTTVGSNYTFELTAVSFASSSDGTDDGQFVSEVTSVAGTYKFDSFGKGDGSTLYPYTITDYTQFNRIRQFTTRSFLLINDIDLQVTDGDNNTVQNVWTPIAGEFTGTIDGGNYTLNNFTSYSIQDANGSDLMALVETNAGTIKNLNIAVNFIDNNDHNALYVATIAIYNTGTIVDVNVTGTISITAKNVYNSGQYGTNVGGLVVYNSGTISNSSVNATIVALDNSDQQVYTGGIARMNSGTISYSHFSGSITSNYIGGIATSNYGIIDSCYVEDATLNVIDMTSSYYAYSLLTDVEKENYTKEVDTTCKTSLAGGIVGDMNYDDYYSSTSSITKSYSKAVIVATKRNSNKSLRIGGLVASLADSSNITINNCCVVADITGSIEDNSDTIYVYNMLGYDDGSSVNVSNNYYYVASDITNALTVHSNSRNDNNVKEVTLDELNAKLPNIK